MQTKYPSSRFAKADRCFTQRIWQNLHANVALFSTPMNRNRARSKAYFTKIYFEFQMPINSKVVFLEKNVQLWYLEIWKCLRKILWNAAKFSLAPMSKGALRVYGFASMCIPNGSRRVIRV
jgi:hypothetical protein